jgi:hypothetical protein
MTNSVAGFRAIVELQAASNTSSPKPTQTRVPSAGQRTLTKSSPPSKEGIKCQILSISETATILYRERSERFAAPL